MVERGHEVTVFCRTTHYRERPSEYLGMHLRYLPAIPQKHLETISHTTASALCLPTQAAIVCMGVGNAPAVRAIEAAGRRTVFNVDGADWQRDKWGAFARWYLRTCESLAARSRSIVVADAKAVHDYYKNVYGRDAEVVPYGADAPADRGTDVVERFQLEPGCYFLFVGRLVPENGPHDILEAARRAGLNAPVVIVGDATYAGEYKAKLKSEAPANTVFTGFQFGSAYQQLSSKGVIRLFRSHRSDIADGHQARDFVDVHDVIEVLWFALSRPIQRGILNLGTGRARTFLDLARSVCKAAGQAESIEFIDTPESLRAQYQYFTEARMERLRASGYGSPFRSLEEGVGEYVRTLQARA